MHAAPLGVGDGAAKSVNYTCVNYKLDGRKATFWNEKKKQEVAHLIQTSKRRTTLPSDHAKKPSWPTFCRLSLF